MVQTAVAADSDEPDRPASVPRPRLEVVPGAPEPETPQLQPMGANVLAASEIERLPAGARHRIAAFIHLQLASLEEMLDPLPPGQPDPGNPE